MNALALAAPPTSNPAPPKNTYGFYLVWNPNGRSPRRRHATLIAAQAEAARLSAKHNNQSFYVLKALTVDRTYIPPVTVRENTHYEHEAQVDDPHFN